MVINLLGNLIDLSMIYRISGLRNPNKFRFNDSEGSDDDEKDWMYSFTIHFLNRKEMRVSCNDDKEGKAEIKRILDELIRLWTPNQISIKSINETKGTYGYVRTYVD